jgi:hypothetical protein
MRAWTNLRELAAVNLNGGGDGGMLQTFTSNALDGTGILSREVKFVTGDIRTNQTRQCICTMIEKKDAQSAITGGFVWCGGWALLRRCAKKLASYSWRTGPTPPQPERTASSNGFVTLTPATTGAALSGSGAAQYGTDRKAYHLTAD